MSFFIISLAWVLCVKSFCSFAEQQGGAWDAVDVVAVAVAVVVVFHVAEVNVRGEKRG